jgi:hypothetical protein
MLTGLIISNDAEIANEELKPLEWHKMDLNQLWEQHAILNKRYLFAQQIQHEQLMNGMSMGITVLNELITKRGKELENNLL